MIQLNAGNFFFYSYSKHSKHSKCHKTTCSENENVNDINFPITIFVKSECKELMTKTRFI